MNALCPGKLLTPLWAIVFRRIGSKAAAGLRDWLNREELAKAVYPGSLGGVQTPLAIAEGYRPGNFKPAAETIGRKKSA